MIYLITGVPGSGKTLYAVSTLVQSLAAQVLKKDGQEIKRRVVVDGIPDLLLPHEVMAVRPTDSAIEIASAKGQSIKAEGNGLWNWPDWCQPGDVIVVDEVQRFWRPRGMGVKPPREIQMLETHRHLGVDFVIITQNPMLIDQNVRRLIGRHQHVRRLLGMQRAIIYDWDACSTTLSTRTATATSFFNYPKSAYALYKSSELHTKQKQKIPLWTSIPVLALVGAVFVGPKAFAVMSGAMTGKGVGTTAQAPARSSSAPNVAALPVTPPASSPAFVPGSAPGIYTAQALPGGVLPKVDYAGCIVANHRCGCFDQKGIKVEVDPGVCEAQTSQNAGKPVQFADTPLPVVMTAEQADTYRFAFAAKPQSLRY